MRKHEIDRKTFEGDREKWAKEKERMMVRHLFELRKEIVRAWMRIEEQEWKKSRETWKEEADKLEQEFKDELNRIKAISPTPLASAAPTPLVGLFDSHRAASIVLMTR